MISVFGSTGNVGGRVAALLLESNVAVRALARSPKKAEPLASRGAEIVEGSMLNLEDVKNAMDRCDAAFLMTPVNYQNDNYVEEEIQIGENYAKALEDSTVEHVVHMSIIGARENTKIPHFESKATIEDAIFASGVDHTIIRPAFFMDNLYRQTDLIRSMDIISLPMPGDVPIPMVATEDIAYAAVQSLMRGPKGDKEEYDILGGRDYTMEEVAEIVSRNIGKEIKYVEMSEEEAHGVFPQMGMSTTATNNLIAMFKTLPSVPVEADRLRIYNEFNFEPTSLEEMVSTIAGALV